MIDQLVKLQEKVRAKSISVGRALQSWGHYAYLPYIGETAQGFPVAAPFLVGMNDEFVYIAIAFDAGGKPVAVQVPTSLFENGGLGDIRTWVTQENIAYAKAQDDIAAQKEEEQRQHELAILNELREKYPNG